MIINAMIIKVCRSVGVQYNVHIYNQTMLLGECILITILHVIFNAFGAV
jgi:hypothetical protein